MPAERVLYAVEMRGTCSCQNWTMDRSAEPQSNRMSDTVMRNASLQSTRSGLSSKMRYGLQRGVRGAIEREVQVGACDFVHIGLHRALTMIGRGAAISGLSYLSRIAAIVPEQPSLWSICTLFLVSFAQCQCQKPAHLPRRTFTIFHVLSPVRRMP